MGSSSRRVIISCSDVRRAALPESLLAAAGRERLLTIPMAPAARSLNLATAAGIVLFEALRQVRMQSASTPE